MRNLLPILVLLLTGSAAWAGPPTAEQSKQAWLLSGEGTKAVECYFWATKTEVSTVACLPLKHPTDDLPIILPVNATDLYHTHPKEFPQLSEADRASERKSGIRIHVIH